MLLFTFICKFWVSMFVIFGYQFSSVSVTSDSLWPHGLLHTRLPCPSLTPRSCSNSCPSSQWCHFILCCPLLILPSIFLRVWHVSIWRSLAPTGYILHADPAFCGPLHTIDGEWPWGSCLWSNQRAQLSNLIHPGTTRRIMARVSLEKWRLWDYKVP